MKRVRNIFISIIYLICIQLLCLINKKRKRIYRVVVYYHSIPYDEIDRFKEQLRILNKITTPIPLEYDGPFDSKKRYSIVTFDDAFKSVISNGIPELVRYKIPCTIFIPAGQLDKKPEWLKNPSHKDKYEMVSSVEELLSIPRGVVTFGSHTVNHRDLRQLGYEEACTEIKESKKMLELKLEREIRYFSFPYGSFDSTLAEYCYEVGYSQVFSIAPESPVEPLRKSVKGRIKVDPSDWRIEFVLKILGGYGWRAISASVRKKLRVLTGESEPSSGYSEDRSASVQGFGNSGKSG